MDVDNHGSRRILERLGFVEEGRHRCALAREGRPADAVSYAMVRSDGDVTALALQHDTRPRHDLSM